MSNSESSHTPSYSALWRRFRPIRPKVHVHRLNKNRKLLLKGSKELAMAVKLKREILQVKNMKLHMLNKIIVEENEKLRRKVMILLQENKSLLAQYQKLPHPDNNTIKH